MYPLLLPVDSGLSSQRTQQHSIRRTRVARDRASQPRNPLTSMSEDTGAGCIAVLVPADGTVADACIAAEAAKRRSASLRCATGVSSSPGTISPMPWRTESPDSGAMAREIQPRAKVAALVCAVVTKDGVHAIGADGVRRAGEEAAETADDRMHLGSCTKEFTATLATVFVAEGAMRGDTSISIGETVALTLPDIDPMWRALTLEQLLRHRGGMPTTPDPKAWAAAFACSDSQKACRTAFVEATLAKPPVGIGTFTYSNQGYAIAGRMIELVAGDTKDFETLLTVRVLAPLGITRFGFGVPTKADADSPVGHTEQGEPREIDNPNAIAPAGTLHMPLGEWGSSSCSTFGRRSQRRGARAAEAA